MALIHYLSKFYGLLVTPGTKTQCPVCNYKRKIFSVKRDATLAKCFHPKCLAYMVKCDWGIYDSTVKNRAA